MHKPHEVTPTPEDVIDVVQIWATIRQHYRFIVGVGLLVFGGVIALTLTSRMEFRSNGRLYLGELEGQSRSTAAASGAFDISAGAPGEVASEIEILRSRSLVQRAILDSGLNVSITPASRGPVRYWEWLLSQRDQSLVEAPVTELRAQRSSLRDRSREAQRFLVRFSSKDNYELWAEEGLVGRGELGDTFEHAGVALTLLPGTTGRPAPGAEYDVVVRNLEDATDRALKVLTVTAPREVAGGDPVNVVTLEFTDASPYMAAAFLEQLMAAYLKERQSWKTEDATAAETFVSKQLESMRDSLDQVQKKLADYRSSNRVVVLDNEAKAMIEQIGKYEEQRVANRLQVAALSDIRRALKHPNPPMGAYLLGEANDTVLEGMAKSLTEARQRLTDLETRFSPAAPDVKEQKAQVEGQLEGIRNYVSSRLTRAQETLGTMNTIIGQFEEKLKTVPGAELGLAQLARESEVYGRTYSYLLERQQQAAIIKASTLSKNRVLDAPQVPHREDSPKLPLRLASLLFGVALGAAIVVLRAFFASTFQSEADVRKSVGALPVFATLARGSKVKQSAEGSELLLPLDRTPSDGSSRLVEGFRTLRTNLYAWRARRGATVVLVTSPASGDGKTTTVLGLACVLAADGKRVLVVDGDIRSHSDEVQVEAGLSDVLTGNSVWQDVIQVSSGSFGHFHVIASGGAGRAELLSSERMRRFVTEARDHFDYVLLDAPSYPAVSDALVLLQHADAAFSVIRLENAARKTALEHVGRIANAINSYALVVNDAGPAAARERLGRGAAPLGVTTDEPRTSMMRHSPITSEEVHELSTLKSTRAPSRLTRVG